MQVCSECEAECPDGAMVCPECGNDLLGRGTEPRVPMANADFDPDEEAEQFERRYGIDIGDRTVDEFLQHLERQDYSATRWYWLIVAAEVAGVGLFAAALFLFGRVGPEFGALFTVASGLLALAIVGDTRVVGQFDRWARIRWAYVLLAAIPLVGHIAGVLYLLLRRLMREQTVKHRRVLLNAGFNLDSDPRS